MRRIAILNQKGGVGKTTTTANLGSALARQGKRVLLADLDPQAHLTMHFGIEPREDVPNLYGVLTGEIGLGEVVQAKGESLFIAPSTIDLAGAEVELASVVGREVIFRDALAQHGMDYDFMLMDCPPSLGILTINALCAADEVFITLQPHFLALQGVGRLLETINLVARRINRDLKVTGVTLCMYETGTKLANEVCADLSHFFAEARSRNLPWSQAVIFTTRIRRNIKLAEAPSFGQDIFSYAPGSHGAEDYAALAREVLSMTDGAESVRSEQPADAPGGCTTIETQGHAHDATHSNIAPSSAEDRGDSIPAGTADLDAPAASGSDTGPSGGG